MQGGLHHRLHASPSMIYGSRSITSNKPLCKTGEGGEKDQQVRESRFNSTHGRVLAVQGRLQFARQVLGLLDLITIGSAYAGDWRRLFARVILRPGTRVEACREGFEAMMRLAGHKLIPKNLDLLPPGAGQLLSLLE
eukprot:1148686-Pelagomonas_calceolata.AAC.3